MRALDATSLSDRRVQYSQALCCNLTGESLVLAAVPAPRSALCEGHLVQVPHLCEVDTIAFFILNTEAEAQDIQWLAQGDSGELPSDPPLRANRTVPQVTMLCSLLVASQMPFCCLCTSFRISERGSAGGLSDLLWVWLFLVISDQ